jgi:2-oxoacid:acceptor oxidoreductase delta subunit (pyruvate/2-ketoisovalerate family)
MPESRETKARDIPAVAVSQTSTRVNKTGSWKYIRPRYRDRVAPCNARCPVGIDVEGYMNLVREGRIWEAEDLLLRENPMPAITGRVCDHPCEEACNRQGFDEPVAIHGVERYLGDLILEQPLPDHFKPWRTERIAVVGSGPAGFACAYHLNRLGYGVTVFESDTQAGGMLRQGIPGYRLPRTVLDRQIEWFEAQGIEIRCGQGIGEGVDWESLSEFAAVFLATGAHSSRAAGMVDEKGPGVRPGLEFLRDVNRGQIPILGLRVAVIGGGNTAMDCARTARRLGSEVTVVYRRTRAEMPAIAAEIEEAEREGVTFRFLAAPRAALRENGVLTGIACTPMELGPPDDSGRRRPIPSETEPEFVLEVDSVLTAIGETPDLGFLPDPLKPRWGTFEVGPLNAVTGESPDPDPAEGSPSGPTMVFAGGDVAEQPRTVAHALGAGKRAALGIDRALHVARGRAPEDWDPEGFTFGPEGNVSITQYRRDDPIRREDPLNEVVEAEDLNPEHFQKVPRHSDWHLPPDDALQDFSEANRGLLPDQALEEAQRCFNCGVCNGCELCLIYCPDFAISRRADGGFTIDMDYCKGCGICAEECPRGAIVMTQEGV